MELYKIIGPEVRQLIQELHGLKPNLLQAILKNMSDIDYAQHGSNRIYKTGSIID